MSRSISVIIRSQGQRPQGLAQALASLARQTFVHFDIIVVEDGGERLAPLLHAWQNDHPHLPLHHQPMAKRGRCHAGNVGASLARTPYICFLDDDDRLFPHHLATLHEVLHHQPREVVAVYAKSVERLRGVIPFLVRDTVVGETPFLPVRLWMANFLPIQSVLMRKEEFLAVGGFDVELEALEDWDLWLRLSQHGRFMGIDRITSLYEHTGSHAQWKRRRAEHDLARQHIEGKHAQRTLTLTMAAWAEQRPSLMEQLWSLAGARDLLRHGLRRLRWRIHLPNGKD